MSLRVAVTGEAKRKYARSRSESESEEGAESVAADQAEVPVTRDGGPNR